MAPIVDSVEIARRPEEVFAYVTDVDRLTEWQQSLVSARRETSEGFAVGSRVAMTRRVGSTERTMTMEVTEASPPSRRRKQSQPYSRLTRPAPRSASTELPASTSIASKISG